MLVATCGTNDADDLNAWPRGPALALALDPGAAALVESRFDPTSGLLTANAYALPSRQLRNRRRSYALVANSIVSLTRQAEHRSRPRRCNSTTQDDDCSDQSGAFTCHSNGRHASRLLLRGRKFDRMDSD